MPTAKVGDINIYYEVLGRGEPVLMIQGGSFPSHGEMWGPLLPALAREYECIIFDNRGAGWTDAPDYPYTFPMMGDDGANLLDYLGFKKVHLIGYSFGSMIAQHCILDHPEKFHSLVLMDGQHIPIVPDAVAAADALVDGWPEAMAQVGALVWFVPEFRDKNPQVVADVVEKFLASAGPKHGFKHQLEASATHSTIERLSQIKVPTLVIDGDQDYLAPLELFKDMHSKIPNAELVLLDGVGHLFPFEDPERTNKAILDFLRRHPMK